MTIIKQSRSIYEGAVSAPSLEHVFERLGTVEGLSTRGRADCRSALRSLARIIDRSLSKIPASPQYLRSRMDELAPARFGLSRGRWANLRSLVLKALKLAGVVALPSRHVSPLLPEWQRLSDLLPKRPQRTCGGLGTTHSPNGPRGIRALALLVEDSRPARHHRVTRQSLLARPALGLCSQHARRLEPRDSG
jgi:hypothetical protein